MNHILWKFWTCVVVFYAYPLTMGVGIAALGHGPSLTRVEKDNSYKQLLNNLQKLFDKQALPAKTSRSEQDVSRGGRMSLTEEDVVPRLETKSQKRYLDSFADDSLSGNENNEHKFLNEWIVHLSGGKEIAKRAIEDLGYIFRGQAKEFEDVYIASHQHEYHSFKREKRDVTDHIQSHPEVLWAEQQIIKKRQKRTVPPNPPLSLKENRVGSFRVGSFRLNTEEDFQNTSVTVDNDSNLIENIREKENLFNDELWPHQWYMFDTRTREDLPELDMKVIPVWNSGITGKGINVVIIDDGLEWKHEDIINNYNPSISYDINDDDSDPTPRYDLSRSNAHGTRCAGEVVMQPNNHKCGVGIAYGASIGGIRMLDGNVTDLTEGLSLARGIPDVDIVSCSWGPNDDGETLEGPGRLTAMALQNGVTRGRQGKGIIYVWAAGNGGLHSDNCNCDGYVSNIFTIGVNSASETGKSPSYSEHCASTLTSTYSSGAYSDQKIVSTDIKNECTIDFTGTSAASPLAAGIIALALEANPDMTWRDIQHAVVRASDRKPLSNHRDWQTNAAGFAFNPKFGFGLLTAEAMVNISRNWTLVPEKRICYVEIDADLPVDIESGNTYKFQSTPSCGDLDMIQSLEHVELIVNLMYSRRGALEIFLISPAGTTTQLLTMRIKDKSEGRFDDWHLVSVHLWGENPAGAWTIKIADKHFKKNFGVIQSLTLVLHGT